MTNRAMVLIAIAVLSCAPTASGALILDQSSAGNGSRENINVCCEFIGQTFTVGLGGALAAVSVDVRSLVGAPMRVGVLETTGGTPGQNVLTSASVIGSSPLDRIIRFASPIAVTPGEVLALAVWFPNVASHSVTAGIWTGTAGNAYGGGQAFSGTLAIDDNYASPIEWRPNGRFGEVDVNFRTYIDDAFGVPVPATAYLFLIGIVAVWRPGRSRGGSLRLRARRHDHP